MRVLVLTPNLEQPGGVAGYYKTLKLNDNSNIDYFYANKLHTQSYFEKISAFFVIYFKYIFSAFKYDIIHLNPSLNIKSFYRDMIFTLTAKIMGKKIAIFFRGWEDDFEKTINNNQLLRLLFMISYARGDAFIVLGEIFKKKLIRLGVSNTKKFYLETTIADSQNIGHMNLDNKMALFREHTNFLFMSRVLKSKGIYITIDAFDACQQKLTGRSMSLYIAGDGEELLNAKRYVKDKKIKNILFTGYVSNGEKYDLLTKSHIMLFPTLYPEGMPNCILEGMLYGMPIISRINASIPNIVEHGKNGFLTDNTDSQSIANYCTELVSSYKLYEDMAKENSSKALQLYSTEKVRSRILNIYTDVAKC